MFAFIAGFGVVLLIVACAGAVGVLDLVQGRRARRDGL
jgi:hypothetical protein